MKSWQSPFNAVASILAPIVSLGSATTAEAQSSSAPTRPQTSAATPSLNGLNDLAWGLQRQMAPRGNLVWSPSDALSLMALYYEGATGETRERAARALGLVAQADRWELPWSKLDVETAKQILIERGDHHDGQKQAVPASYQKLATDLYKAKIEIAAFHPLAELTKRVNTWVKEKTRGLIPRLVEESDLQGASLILLSAVYFRAQWEDPFDLDATHEDVFRVGPKERVKTKFMNRSGEYSIFEGQDVQVLIVDYLGRQAAMVLVLPREGLSLEEFESRISATDLQRWIGLAQPSRVWLKLPKFEHSWRSAMDQAVVDLGFPRKGDFSRIGQKELELSRMIHQALIRVDEQGTEAAAATMMAAPRGAPAAPPKEFHLTRPFLYFVFDQSTRTWAFSGRFAKP